MTSPSTALKARNCHLLSQFAPAAQESPVAGLSPLSEKVTSAPRMNAFQTIRRYFGKGVRPRKTNEKKLESMTHRDHRGQKTGPMLAASVKSGGPNGLLDRGRIG